MVQAFDYFHEPGNSGISPFMPLVIAPLGRTFSTTPTAQRLAFQPFFVGDLDVTVAQLAVYLRSTGYVSGGRWRLGIYNTSPPEDQDVYPKALVHDFGLTATPTGAATEFVTTSAVSGTTLTNGLYYVASVMETVVAASFNTLSNECPASNANGTSFWPFNDNGGTVTGLLGWWLNAVTNPANPLPVNAPAGMTFSQAAFSPEQWNPTVFPRF